MLPNLRDCSLFFLLIQLAYKPTEPIIQLFSLQCKESDVLAVAELQREVEDLRLRLQMAAEHYKDKYKECQKLQKQVVKFSEQQGVSTPSLCNCV